ncbi:Acetyltransferase, GNAT family [Aphelenchoides bicaudatus]|nr:Acetyltransferase, GNAT family [Aphelenchoides bicaudatus]
MSSCRKYELPKAERECLVEKFHLKTLNRDVRFEVADEKDHEVIVEFLKNEFITREPMNNLVQTPVNVFADYINPVLEAALPQRLTVLAIDDGCLCGMFLNRVLKSKHIAEEPKMKDDYGEEYDANNSATEGQKKIGVVLEIFEGFVSHYLPASIDEYVFLDILSVHKSYLNNGLATKLTVESCKRAHKKGFEWVQVTGSAVATNKIAQNLGFTTMFSLDLKNFRAHGKQMFEDEFCDGGKQIGAYIAESQKIASNHD